MIEVEPLHEGDEFKTDVWAATKQVIERMVKAIRKDRDAVERFRRLIHRAARHGFSGLPSDLLRDEYDKVYAIGERKGPLYRAGGFFHEDADKETFVLMIFFKKHGQQSRANEKENYKQIARVRDNRKWRLVRDCEDEPGTQRAE